MATPATAPSSSKGKQPAHNPAPVSNFEFKKKDVYEGDIVTLVKQLKTSITDIEVPSLYIHVKKLTIL